MPNGAEDECKILGYDTVFIFLRMPKKGGGGEDRYPCSWKRSSGAVRNGYSV